MNTNHTDNELTAGLFCVTQAHGRAHFTSDRIVALDAAEQVRELLRRGGLSGVHNVGTAYLGADNQWHPCRRGR